MRQLALGYKPAHVAKSALEDLLAALQQAVLHLGLKEVTYELDVAKSTVSEALSGNSDRRWAHEWTLTVLAMLSARHNETCDRLARNIHDAEAAVSPRFSFVERDEFSDEEIAAAERVLAAARKRKRAA